MTDMPILYFYAVLAIDKKAFLRISSKDQITVRSVMGRVFKDIDQQNRRDNLAAFVALKNQGIQLSQPTDEEVADWRNKAQVVTEQLLQSGAVSRQLYRQLTTYLEACRSQQARLQEGK